MLSDSMGSVPVAAVRSAVEATWRALCVHADAVALGDIIEVVARVDKSVSRDGDDMFEEADGEDEEEEEDPSSGSGSGSEDEGSSEDGDDAGLSGVGDAKTGALGKSNSPEFKNEGLGRKRGRDSQNDKTSGGQESDDEAESDAEDSDGGLDDAAMFRIDKYLAQTFSTLKSGRQVCHIAKNPVQYFRAILSLWLSWFGIINMSPRSKGANNPWKDSQPRASKPTPCFE